MIRGPAKNRLMSVNLIDQKWKGLKEINAEASSLIPLYSVPEVFHIEKLAWLNILFVGFVFSVPTIPIDLSRLRKWIASAI